MDAANQLYREFPIHFMGRLHNDFSGSTNSLLIPGVDVYIDLELLDPNIFLMSNTQKESVPYTYEISDIKIHIPVATMTQEMFTRFNAKLQHTPALYNLRKTSLGHHTIPKGSTIFFNDALFPQAEQPNKQVN